MSGGAQQFNLPNIEEFFDDPSHRVPTDESVTVIEMWRWLRAHERMERAHQESVEKRLKAIEDTLSQVRGGWKVLLVLGGLVTSLGIATGWVMTHFNMPTFRP